MIGAIIRHNIVENLLVLKEEQIEELSTALQCEIIDARPYGLIKGDLRTNAGWTRNADGEQILLPLLENKSYDSYSLIAEENVALSESFDELNEQIVTAETTGARGAISEALDFLAGEKEEEDIATIYSSPEQEKHLKTIRKALDGFIDRIIDSATEINDNYSIIRKWHPGIYTINDVRIYENIPYKCVQAHDSTDNSTWNPTVASLWMQYHGTSADTARAWVTPTGAHDMYKSGEYMIWTDGNIYKCISDTIYSPIEYSSAWLKEGDEEETSEIQDWISGNSYMTGDHVLYEGVEYESVIDNNVWSPADYPAGWEEVVTE